MNVSVCLRKSHVAQTGLKLAINKHYFFKKSKTFLIYTCIRSIEFLLSNTISRELFSGASNEFSAWDKNVFTQLLLLV